MDCRSAYNQFLFWCVGVTKPSAGNQCDQELTSIKAEKKFNAIPQKFARPLISIVYKKSILTYCKGMCANLAAHVLTGSVCLPRMQPNFFTVY